MSERNNGVTLKGKPMTLAGQLPQEGQKAPDFELRGTDLSPKRLSDYGDKIKVISVVPSLDTAVCDTETRKFNELATDMGDDVVVITVSMDLPMAQKRWCGAAGVDRVECLSDYMDHRFGDQYGVRMQEVGLLARTVLVLDRDNTVRHVQLVKEVAEEPDYDAVLDAVKKLK